MKAKNRKKSFIFVEVLQNGSHLADFAYPTGQKNIIKVTAKPSGELSIPFYPLADDVEVFQTTKKGAKIILNSTWDGFVSKHGEFLTITYDNCDSFSFDLIDGDFGCLNLKDLKILFRIGPPKVALSPSINKQYLGSIVDLAFDGPQNIKYFLGSVCLTALLFSLAMSSLFIRRDSTPNKLSDLKKEYLLPLIHPDHLKTLPEAMQLNLDRSIPLTCSINYYSAIVAMLLNLPNPNQNLLFPTSTDLYSSLHKSNRAEIANFAARQQEQQKQITSKGNQGIIAIPAVVGETFAGRLLRISDKISLLHENFNSNLELKREYAARVEKASKKDLEYNYEDYRNLNTSSDSGADILKKIRVLDKYTNEDAMYVELKTLGKEAAFVQNRIKESSSKKSPLSSTAASPIGIGISDPNISFLVPANLDDFNQKIGMIVAGEFTPTKPEKVREALVGEIRKDLIDKVVNTNRFDLQLCFELALRRNQGLSGGMDFKWRLDSRGEMSELEVIASTIRDRQMEKCVLKKIASWRFPRPNRGSVEINHHFSFSPAKG